MKIQPIDSYTPGEPTRLESAKPVVKSLFKRFFELQFLRNSTAEKAVGVGGGGGVDDAYSNKDGPNGSAEFEPSSICLARMVQNFIEESNDKQSSAAVRCGGKRCKCFNGNYKDSLEDEFDSFGVSSESSFVSSGEAIENLKNLVPCASVIERNLLADISRIVDKNKICKRKDDFCRKIVTDGLLSLGYDASICKSRWEKSHSRGEYEYIDVIISGERLLIDIDFRSEFEIARSTKAYKSLLQTLPYIFVGKGDRLQKIISVVSDAAKQSLKKKGMHIPPWRKPEYVKAKWLSPHTRATTADPMPEKKQPLVPEAASQGKNSAEDVFALSSDGSVGEDKVGMMTEWKPPDIKPKNFSIGVKPVTGLASVIEDDP